MALTSMLRQHSLAKRNSNKRCSTHEHNDPFGQVQLLHLHLQFHQVTRRCRKGKVLLHVACMKLEIADMSMTTIPGRMSRKPQAFNKAYMSQDCCGNVRDTSDSNANSPIKVDGCKGQGLARFHLHLAKMHLAVPLQEGLYEIFVAHGDTSCIRTSLL